MKRCIVILVVGVLALAFSARATIINVPGDQPTIQAGIDVSSHGDTVRVASGTYVENISFSGRNIVVGSWFLDAADTSYVSSTIIDGNQSGRVVSFVNAEDNTAIITGFTIQNGHTTSFGGGILCYNNSGPTISNNNITGNSAAYDGGGILCFHSSPTISNNTISGNSATRRGGGIYCWDSSPVITNTIFWGDTAPNAPEIHIQGTSSPVITYCDIQGGWEGEGNINCDPMFCYPDTGNYYLHANSCCVGAGEGGVDIGAFGIGCGEEEIPTLSEWGMIILGLLLLAAGTIAVIRRRKAIPVSE